MKDRTNGLFYIDPFDPVTEGDFCCAQEAGSKLGVDVAFLPLPDRFLVKPGADLASREEMLRLYLAGKGSLSLLSPKPWLETLKEENGRASLLLKKETYRLLMEKGLLASPNPERTVYLLGGERIGEAVPLSLSSLPPSPSKARNLACPGIGPELWAYIERKRLYYAGYLQKKLASEHRFQHSLSVAHLCYRIAVSNGLEKPERAYIAGIFHDLGKHCPQEEERSIMEGRFPEYLSFPPWSYHQFTGKYLAERELGIEDEGILDAIEFHSTGKKGMSPLGKIVYASDKIDPLRGYDSGAMIQECLEDYRKGFLTVLKENRAYLTKKGYKVDNPLTEECFRYYLGD